MPEDRCGYVHDVTAIPNVGETTCWRPTWGDRDRCVWHADEDGKPAKLYFSVVTFATLGFGDISPVGSFARFLAGVESLFGSLLLALLVYVLTMTPR